MTWATAPEVNADYMCRYLWSYIEEILLVNLLSQHLYSCLHILEIFLPFAECKGGENCSWGWRWWIRGNWRGCHRYVLDILFTLAKVELVLHIKTLPLIYLPKKKKSKLVIAHVRPGYFVSESFDRKKASYSILGCITRWWKKNPLVSMLFLPFFAFW